MTPPPPPPPPSSDAPADAAAAGTERLVAWARPRVLVVGTAFVAGFVLGTAGALALATRSPPATASTQVFATGALVLGFGVLGWAGSAMAGRGVEAMQAHLDTGTSWTETDSRRAMARITGVGAGVMCSVVVVTPLL